MHESNKLKDTMVRTCIVRAGNVFARNGKIDRVRDFTRITEIGRESERGRKHGEKEAKRFRTI